MKWLRRRILASVATQTAETFAVVAVVAFVVMYWRTSEGPLTSLFGSVVIAQLVAGARIGHAMRNNPLNYVFMRKYVERPFTYRVSRFQGEDQAHPAASRLPGFAPVATIRDSEADPEPVFDVYHDPSRLVAASVSRASGSIALISSLADGRILVTDTRAMPPHERLVMSLAEDDSVEAIISTHRRALSARSDVVELASSAHQVVLDSLAVEYDAYAALGPALSPFLDLEPKGRSALRLTARIAPDELAELPTRLGPDLPMRKSGAQPDGHKASSGSPSAPVVTQPTLKDVSAPPTPVPEMPVPSVKAPTIAPIINASTIDASTIDASTVNTPMIDAPVIEASTIDAPVINAPMVEAPIIAAPHVSVSVVAGHESQVTSSPAADGEVLDIETAQVPETSPAGVAPVIVEFAPFTGSVTPSISAAPIGTETQVRIGIEPLAAISRSASDSVISIAAPAAVGPTPFMTRYPDGPDVERPGEPITAEVPAVVFTSAPSTLQPPVDVAAFASSPAPAVPAPVDIAPAVIPAPISESASVFEIVGESPSPAEGRAESPVASVLVPAAAMVGEPAAVVAPPVSPVLVPPVAVVAAPSEPAAVVAPLVSPVVAPAAASVFVPSEPAAVVDPVGSLPPFTNSQRPAPATLAEAVVAAPDTAAELTGGPIDYRAPTSVAASAAPAVLSSAAGQLGSDLAAALGYTDEPTPTRPRLSAVLRANSAADAGAGSAAKRTRRKSR